MNVLQDSSGDADKENRLVKESDMAERLHFHFSLSCIGEGNGNPLQCSCLENLRDGGAWWAAVYGVAQSWTLLKQLSSSNVIRQKGKNMINIFCLAVNDREGNGNPLQYSCLETPMDRGAWWAVVHGVEKSRTRLSDFPFTSLSCIGEGNGNPLQYSCRENPMDREAWQATVHGVAKIQI